MKFDDFDKDLMVETVKTLLNVGFRIVYGYTESDEISLLFHPKDHTFGRKVRKINTTLAGEASAAFSLALGKAATYCYWALRKEGKSQNDATIELEGKSVAYKNELLFQRGINYNELPPWQKRGIGVYFTDAQKEGFNPIKKEKVVTQRRELFVDYEIPLGEDYREFILQFLDED